MREASRGREAEHGAGEGRPWIDPQSEQSSERNGMSKIGEHADRWTERSTRW